FCQRLSFRVSAGCKNRRVEDIRCNAFRVVWGRTVTAKLAGKKALVTGSSQGIGEAMATAGRNGATETATGFKKEIRMVVPTHHGTNWSPDVDCVRRLVSSA